jgi:hypothetical protein
MMTVLKCPSFEQEGNDQAKQDQACPGGARDSRD